MVTTKPKICPTLLAVDGDSAFLTVLQIQLRKMDFRVHIATTLRNADSILGRQFVNLVLTNVSVHGECAIEFVENLHRNGRKVPTIFTLDRLSGGDRLRALEVGDDVVAEPLLLSELAARIRAFSAGQKLPTTGMWLKM
jgi:DNA-binding response OmpR family regulator